MEKSFASAFPLTCLATCQQEGARGYLCLNGLPQLVDVLLLPDAQGVLDEVPEGLLLPRDVAVVLQPPVEEWATM